MQLQWTNSVIPFAPSFEDKYYADEGGFEEANYVFLGQNSLPERFKTQTAFTIGELGFGTGTNFFATWKAWVEHSRGTAWLTYYAIEKFPLSSEQIQRATSAFPEIEGEVKDFLKLYELPVSGIHLFEFEKARIRLFLCIGDVQDVLSGWPEKRMIDAWYFDGFAPRKNPEMWSEATFRLCAKYSHSMTTFATFTAAGHVKRALEAAGFKTEKFKGFGRKKEMLKGQYMTQTNRLIREGPQSVAIVGAGFAGLFTALAFARRGVSVTLFDQNERPCQDASGNTQAATMPMLTAEPSDQAKASLLALAYLPRAFSGELSEIFNQTGALILARRDKEFSRFERFIQWANAPKNLARIVDPEEATALAGVKISENALYLPTAGWLHPKKLAEVILRTSQERIEFRASARIDSLEDLNSFEKIVLANSFDCVRLLPNAPLAYAKVRGQVIDLESSTISENLKCILSAEKYIVPGHNQMHSVGSTYSRTNESLDVDWGEAQEIHSALIERFPDLCLERAPIQSSRVGFRMSTPNYLPYVSQVDSRVYVNAGYGSKGLLYASLFGANLAALICEGAAFLKNFHPGCSIDSITSSMA